MVMTMTDYAAEREAMIEWQLRRRGIREQPILDAFRAVPQKEIAPRLLATRFFQRRNNHPGHRSRRNR